MIKALIKLSMLEALSQAVAQTAAMHVIATHTQSSSWLYNLEIDMKC